MNKIYKSRSSISINVVLANKKSMHIAFTSQSDGSSVYITGNEAVQKALERHYQFGKLFRFTGVSHASPKDDASAEDAASGKATAPTSGETVSEKRKVTVSDYTVAKDFLADTFGLSRTSLRSQKAILEAAEQHNIEFEGLE